MEKLIKLLNEYEAERHKTSIIADIREQKGDDLSYLWMNYNYSELLCISKGYEFIKWLVKKDKIDFYKVGQAENELEVDVNIYRLSYEDDNYYWLLMILSIEDEPIKFLISVLK